MASTVVAARTTRRRTFTALLPALALASILGLSGCSLPGLPGPTGAPAAETTSAAVPEQAAAVTPIVATPVTPNDLATGSASHTLGAAENQLVVDYWTAEKATALTAASTPIVQVSAKVVGSTGGRSIKITRFNARVDSLNTVLANDTGDFAIDAPHAYSSALQIPANPGATSTRVVFTFDLLTETAAGTGVFTRQTVMDSLTIGYAEPAPQTTPQTTK